MQETEPREPMEAQPQPPPPPEKRKRRSWDQPKPGDLAGEPETWREQP